MSGPGADGWETVIGLEIHVQLSTRSKLFSGAATAFGGAPNTQASAVDLGLPGVLPVANLEAFRKAAAFGFAVGAKVNQRSVFDRKNYFYPDLPKGYQITQLHEPIVENGQVEINTDAGTKSIRILRAHLEEDAGKSLHQDIPGMSGIDLNRAGTPLIEIVTEPDLRSADEAVACARLIHQLVCWLDISDGDLSQGSFRCDVNISMRPFGAPLGTRTEIKNVNSFRFLRQAANHEADRQLDLLRRGEKILQETRLYDPDKDETRSMRGKETAMDYRYFPEPDLLPVELSEDFLAAVKAGLPELPAARRQRFMAELGLPEADAEALTASRRLADCFETVHSACGDAKLAANWTRVELLGALNREDKPITEAPIQPEQLGGLLKLVLDQTISSKQAKQVFETMWATGDSAESIVDREGLRQESDSDTLRQLVKSVLTENPNQVEQYLSGKTKVMGFLIGQVMKKTKGQANPKLANQLMSEELESLRA